MEMLVIYDVMGIQDFIFASPKVRENLGASIIVEEIFKKDLKDSIEKVCAQNCRTDWREDYTDFQIVSDPNMLAEVIYVGGGNAMVAYRDEGIAKKVTQALSYKVMEQTGDALKFAVAYQPIDFANQTFSNDRDTIFRELKKNKYGIIQTKPMLGIGITRPGATDGFPATYPGDEAGEFLSKSAKFKRRMIEQEYHKLYFDDLLPDDGKYAFPLEFDDLGQKEGENHIAVVHIDGNNLGKLLDGALDGISDYQEAVTRLRNFSKEVDKNYKDVMRDVIQRLTDWVESNKSKKDFPLSLKDNLLPIRPIVRSGDDITFVCNAKIAISLTELFLMALHKLPPISFANSQVPLSACAGVVIVKSHFPFYRAYQLAEELCASAKMKAKTLAQLNKREEIGNWLDFHIIQSGVTTNLREIREKFYQVPGMKPPDKLTFPRHSPKPEMRYPQYNLLWRPWCIAGECGELYDWQTFKAIHHAFTKKDKKEDDEVLWKQSRLKKLRNVMIKSESDIDCLIQEYQSRGFTLPKCFGDCEPFKTNHDDDSELQQTPYFDALELLDFYEPIA